MTMIFVCAAVGHPDEEVVRKLEEVFAVIEVFDVIEEDLTLAVLIPWIGEKIKTLRLTRMKK